MKMKIVNPHDQTIIEEIKVSGSKEINNAVSLARNTLPEWREVPLVERANYLSKIAFSLKKNKKQIAELVTKEMGKPISQSLEDVDGEVDYLNWYANEGAKALKTEDLKRVDKTTYEIVYEPWGVVAAIAPWNFPVSMVSSGVSPALLAGNTVVFKPSEYSTLSQKMFVDLFNQTGLPKGALNIVIGDGRVGEQLVEKEIDYVWFTGSTSVGREIYEKASKKFIKVALELGGSDPVIVLDDVNPKDVVKDLYWGRFLNCGQVCSAMKRLFVHKSLYKDIVKGLVNKLETVSVGNPLDESTDIGPLVTKKQLGTLTRQVSESVEMGAKVEIGGKKVQDRKLSKGNYYEPTILTNVSFDMPVMKEETFGPVLPIMSFSSEKEAVEMANNTQWGLSAYVYTNNIEKGRRIAAQIKSGSVGINTDSLYKPFCPIGGMKLSGIGKEYGVHGVREFAQMKLLAVKNYD